MSAPEKPEPEPRFDPYSIIGYLVAGMLFYGAVGWGLDRWVGTHNVFTPIGIIFGLAAGLFLTFRRLAVMEKQERAAYLAEKQKYLREPQHDRRDAQDAAQHDRTERAPDTQHDPKHDR